MFELLVDDDNIVSIAARECFVYIANKKIKNFVVDQGPSPHADKAEKYQASCLWKKFMKLHNLFHNECNSYELQAFDELIKKVEEEESNKIFRKKIKSQLEKVDYYFPKNNFFESDQELEDNIPHDLVDPSSFTVKAIIKNVYFRKEEVLTF